jgi:AcrR family transcriptional regulator
MAPRRRPTLPPAPARERLIAAADELFSRDGIAATPVDEAVRRAGVATATLYHHFDGKDALVAAYLRDRHERWMRRWERHVAAAADPAGALLSIFDALDEWEREGGAARGCAFVDAAAELGDRSHPAWREISGHKEGVRARLVQLAEDAGRADAETLADRLLLLYEGAMNALLVGYLERPIAQSRAVAEGLVGAGDSAG